MRLMLELCTDGGGIAIHEDDLSTITDAKLQEWRISRDELCRCFAEGIVLMRDKTESDRLRPCA
jgi:hypothetical protein